MSELERVIQEVYDDWQEKGFPYYPSNALQDEQAYLAEETFPQNLMNELNLMNLPQYQPPIDDLIPMGMDPYQEFDSNIDLGPIRGQGRFNNNGFNRWNPNF